MKREKILKKGRKKRIAFKIHDASQQLKNSVK
jgi:hypothetical protein